jgi:predicted permease
MEVLLIFWIGFSLVVAVAANTRGRNGLGWFLLALIISPLLAGLFVLALPHKRGIDIATMAAIEATPQGSQARQMLQEKMRDEKLQQEYKKIAIITAAVILGLLWMMGVFG